MSTKQPRNSIASFLSTDDEISVELNKCVMEPSMIDKYLEEFSTLMVPKSMITTKIAKLYYQSKNSDDVKSKIIGSDKASMFNEKIKTFKVDSSAIAIRKKITPITSVPQIATRAELIVQYTMTMAANANWMIKISIVKRIDNSMELETRLKSFKIMLMDTSFEKMTNEAFDYVTTELLRINPEPIDYMQLLELIHLVSDKSNTDQKNDEYQNAIFNLARDIFRDVTTITKFKRDSGFKRLCPSPIELNRILYFKKVIPAIDNYYITDKMDGLHALLVIDEIFKIGGKKKNYIGANIYAVSDKIYNINTCDYKRNRSTIVEHTVLDVEMMEEKNGEHSFHCFDVIALASRRVNGIPFYKRIEYFGAANELLEKYELGSTKEFIRLTSDKYCEQIKEFYKKPRNYKIDGIIFTPAGTFFKEAIKLRKSKFEKIFNTEYSNTISFKWKPLDQLTIDFYIMDYPKKNTYALCSGVDSKTFKLLKMSFFDGYKAPDSPNSFQYFPIQFETYDGEFNFQWKPSKEDETIIGDLKTLNGMVGEFRLANDNGILENPQLLRLRTDRISDIERGEYYGNALRYSELIWHSIKYPLKIVDMCNPTNNAYFAAEDTDGWYKAGRGFNSFVKTHLMELYLPVGKDSRLMDIAAGKGQDLARSVELGYSDIVAMDKDTDALTELLERKYNLRVKSRHASASIHIKKIDLENTADENIKNLKIPTDSVDNIMINFAIHYICHSGALNTPSPVDEFIKLCKFYLKQGGRVMITTFNGQDVFDKLKNSDEWDVVENNRIKYSIKRDFASDTMTDMDQQIDVLLPFSAGEYYKEYLVNYKYVQQRFEQNGFSMIKSDSFESLLRAFKKQNNNGYKGLTEGDKEYVSLYGYMIFEKK